MEGKNLYVVAGLCLDVRVRRQAVAHRTSRGVGTEFESGGLVDRLVDSLNNGSHLPGMAFYIVDDESVLETIQDCFEAAGGEFVTFAIDNDMYVSYTCGSKVSKTLYAYKQTIRVVKDQIEKVIWSGKDDS